LWNCIDGLKKGQIDMARDDIKAFDTFRMARNATVNNLAGLCYRNVVEKGFHSQQDSGFIKGQEEQRIRLIFAVHCANLHGEVSELWEAYRNDTWTKPCDKTRAMQFLGLPVVTAAAEELADVIIRAFDTAVTLGIDIGEAIAAKHAYNTTRPGLHGGKKA
jgi:NTP pyrophosphatase (non-canonical NTP hydrolase)